MLAVWGQHQEVCLVLPALGMPVFKQHSLMPQSSRVPCADAEPCIAMFLYSFHLLCK